MIREERNNYPKVMGQICSPIPAAPGTFDQTRAR